MKGLLIKDLRLMKNMGNSLAIILLVAVGMSFYSSDMSFIVIYLAIIGTSFTSSTISYDEFDNGNAFALLVGQAAISEALLPAAQEIALLNRPVLWPSSGHRSRPAPSAMMNSTMGTRSCSPCLCPERTMCWKNKVDAQPLRNLCSRDHHREDASHHHNLGYPALLRLEFQPQRHQEHIQAHRHRQQH